MSFGAAMIGLVVAFFVGLTSTGGGSLLTPALVLGLGVSPAAAIGADLVSVTAMKSVCVAVYARRRDVEWRLAGWLAIGSIPGALVASLLGHRIPVGIRDDLLRRGVGVALLAAGALSLWQNVAPRAVRADSPRSRGRALTVTIGAATGMLAGLTSVGAGSLLIMFFAASYPMALRRLVGTDLAHAVALTTFGALGHGLVGDIDWRLAIAVTIGALPGAVLGACVAGRIPDRWLRIAVGFALAVAGAALLGGKR